MPKWRWQVINDKNVIIDNDGADITTIDEKIIYNDEYGKHIINKSNKTYKKISEDNEVSVDFNENTMSFLIEGKELKYDIENSWEETKEDIILTYSLGEEEIKIIVTKGDEDEKNIK